MPDLTTTKAAIKKVLGIAGQALGLLDVDTNVTTVGSTATRGEVRVHNVLDTTNDEYLSLTANGTDGYAIGAVKTGTGSTRALILKTGTFAEITIAANGAINFHSNTVSNLYLNSANLKMYDSDVSNVYTFAGGNIAGDYTLTWPAVTASDIMVSENMAQTLTAKIYSGFKQTDAAKTGAYTLLTTDSVIRADASGSEYTLTLPAASGNAGLTYTIIRTDVASSVHRLILDANASELINGNLTYVLYPAQSIIIECTGTAWECIAQPEPAVGGYYFNKGATANRRYIAGQINSNAALLTSTTAVVANTLWAMPIIVSRTTKFDTISAEVTTLGSGSNMRLGIYADDGNCYPDVLIYDSGNISAATTGVKDSTITASLQVFNPGLYWLTYEHSATIPQIRILPASGYIPLFPPTLGTTIPGYAYSVAHTVGALPNPYTAGGAIRTAVSAVGAPVPAVGLRAV